MIKEKKCPECSSEDSYNFNPFDCGELIDEHMDIEIDDSELSKRYENAIKMSKMLGGSIPSGLEGEISELNQPKLRWQDFINHIKVKIKNGKSKNNWNSPKRKLLFSGLYVPKKIDYNVKFLMAYDCSASMKKEEIAYGISQVQVLNNKGDGWCLPWDSSPYFESLVKIKNANAQELKNAKYKGGGGTKLLPVFQEYEKHIGAVDIIIIISDFRLADLREICNMKQIQNTHVVWLGVGDYNEAFIPPFGRVFKLDNYK